MFDFRSLKDSVYLAFSSLIRPAAPLSLKQKKKKKIYVFVYLHQVLILEVYWIWRRSMKE